MGPIVGKKVNDFQGFSTACLPPLVGIVLRRINALLSLIKRNWTRNKSGAPKLTILSLTVFRRSNEALTMIVAYGPRPLTYSSN